MSTDPSNPAEAAKNIQRRYWNFNRTEYARLREKLSKGTSWEERLRLLHLCCSGLMKTDKGKIALAGGTEDGDADHHGLGDLAAKLAGMLISKKSPYRPRNSAIWLGNAPPASDEQPHRVGVAMNASLSHLGCIEYITMNEHGQPGHVSFAPMHRVRTLVMASPSLFRAAKITFEDQHEEMVFIPLIYSFSWSSSEPSDKDGTLTRFTQHVQIPGSERSFGIGLGQQDWTISVDNGASLIGLGSISLVDMPLDLRDHDWEEKARLRGLDPTQIKLQYGHPE